MMDDIICIFLILHLCVNFVLGHLKSFESSFRIIREKETEIKRVKVREF